MRAWVSSLDLASKEVQHDLESPETKLCSPKLVISLFPSSDLTADDSQPSSKQPLRENSAIRIEVFENEICRFKMKFKRNWKRDVLGRLWWWWCDGEEEQSRSSCAFAWTWKRRHWWFSLSLSSKMAVPFLFLNLSLSLSRNFYSLSFSLCKSVIVTGMVSRWLRLVIVTGEWS